MPKRRVEISRLTRGQEKYSLPFASLYSQWANYHVRFACQNAFLHCRAQKKIAAFWCRRSRVSISRFFECREDAWYLWLKLENARKFQEFLLCSLCSFDAFFSVKEMKILHFLGLIKFRLFNTSTERQFMNVRSTFENVVGWILFILWVVYERNLPWTICSIKVKFHPQCITPQGREVALPNYCRTIFCSSPDIMIRHFLK